MDCGNCGRAIHESRPACLYCGWAPSPSDSSAPGGLLTPPEPSPTTYRSGASLARFLFWSILCSGAAWLSAARNVHWPWLSAAFVFVGPVAFLPYLLRYHWVRVTVFASDGLLTHAGRLISWDEIESIEARGIRIQADDWMFNTIREYFRTWTLQGDVGLLSLITIITGGAVIALLFLAGLLSGLMVPILIVLSPWQRRVVLTLRDGRRQVWRDLSGDLDLVHEVEAALRQRR